MDEMNKRQKFLSWLYVRGPLMRPGLHLLNNIYKLGRLPLVRARHPWMTGEKSEMSYLPINKDLGPDEKTHLPPQIVHEFIDKARHHVIMDTCGCRLAFDCQNFPHDIGCLFMGETALQMPAKIRREVTREEAHAHVERAVEAGLNPMIGKVRVDNFIFLTPDKGKLLSVCFCCHCCCMMGYFKHLPAEHLDQVLRPLEGLSIEVTEKCVGCGKCVETCIFEAIRVEDGRVAIHTEKCRGCGRCAVYCPEKAVKIELRNEGFIEDAMRRIGAYIDLT